MSTNRSRPTIPIRRWRSPWRDSRGNRRRTLVPRFWAPGWNSVQSLTKFQEEVNGPLRGGDSGRRLIEPAGDGKPAYFTRYSRRLRDPRPDEWLLVPLHHIFGSEELSVLSPGLRNWRPRRIWRCIPTMPSGFDVQEGDEIEVGRRRRAVASAGCGMLPSLPRASAACRSACPAWARSTCRDGSDSRRSPCHE